MNILVHFSKFLISFLIKKNGKEIAFKLKYCFDRFGIPEQVVSDNGSEFINNDVNSLMEKYNIKYIHGKPYKKCKKWFNL